MAISTICTQFFSLNLIIVMPILQVYTTLARSQIPAKFAANTAQLLGKVLNKPITAMTICVNCDQIIYSADDVMLANQFTQRLEQIQAVLIDVAQTDELVVPRNYDPNCMCCAGEDVCTTKFRTCGHSIHESCLMSWQLAYSYQNLGGIAGLEMFGVCHREVPCVTCKQPCGLPFLELSAARQSELADRYYAEMESMVSANTEPSVAVQPAIPDNISEAHADAMSTRRLRQIVELYSRRIVTLRNAPGKKGCRTCPNTTLRRDPHLDNMARMLTRPICPLIQLGHSADPEFVRQRRLEMFAKPIDL
ncbi:unnamed protein product [Medioppia subpectinata]|uniref:Uncharacterized protein n=1 Tax=Medioppia subpectinata TaxID=1979941 RepID=A0A7R9KEE8_9ACAR|nr:unnamed protein product [Medioppia subpectinata]CAG2100601.1 unnamed protein product [Medioppia subpectinata]